MSKTLIMAFDIGTTGVKTCLFEVDKTVNLVGAAMEGYSLHTKPDGSAEQIPSEWWSAICNTSKKVVEKTGVDPKEISGISFCSQMQGLVIVDDKGEPIRNAFSYMDQRAKQELKENMAYGIQIAGANIFKLIPSLLITGAVSASVKDPVYKYKWVEKHEPDNFKKIYKWLDVKEYIICKMTGKCVMTQDSAFGTLLYDIRDGKRGWSKTVCKLLGVDMKHLPEIVKSTDKVGGLTNEAAAELGLCPGTAVFGGGGDASLIGVGAGATALGRFHSEFMELQPGQLEVLNVINVRRPMSGTAEKIVSLQKELERNARLQVTGFINNTNLQHETTAEELEDGYRILRDVSEQTGIPVVYTAGTNDVIKQFLSAEHDEKYVGKPIELQRIMRRDWDSYIGALRD